MTDKEKIFLIQCLLEDIRCNWGWDVQSRVRRAKELCDELGGEFETLSDECTSFLKLFEDGDTDGRYFRSKFPYGYEDMDKLHKLPHTFKDKSKAFQYDAEYFLTYPEYRFDDWEEDI